MPIASHVHRDLSGPTPSEAIGEATLATLSLGERRELVEKLSEHEYTRYPVTNGDPESFIGFIHSKEVLTAIAAGRSGRIEGFLHKIPQFTESATLREVMLSMQQNRVHMASVSDPSGRTIGLVTMEDILEEIVGDMRDEADGVRLPPVVL